MTDLTPEEQTNVRLALRFLRARWGGWKLLAKAFQVKADSLSQVNTGRRGITPRLALRVARFADVAVDDVLAGKYPPEGVCPTCGHAGPGEATDAH